MDSRGNSSASETRNLELFPGMNAQRPPHDMQEFEYPLPDKAIAQMPAVPRDSAKLLVDKDQMNHLNTSPLRTSPINYKQVTYLF